MIRRMVLVVFVAVAVVIGGVIMAFALGGDATTATVATISSTTSAVATTTTAATTTSTTPTTVAPTPIGVPDQPDPAPPAPPPRLTDDFTGTGAVIVAAGGADLASNPGDPPLQRVREGLVFAGQGFDPDQEWIRVFHSCDGEAWIRADEIAVVPPADTVQVGAGFDFADAVLVIDPGHGGPNEGAVSSDGLMEKEINAEISARLRDLLTVSHSIEWETGTILAGDEVPPAGEVILTRTGEGDRADYEAGLRFRATLANAVGAHAMVSIHNNAGWKQRTEVVGSEVYYQSQDHVTGESRRLAELLVEEFRRGFAGFDADWVGGDALGAKSRVSPRDGTTQYYGLLRWADVPTVIAEGAYIANPSEAALLRTPEFRQAYAEAVYRALVRYLTTDDLGDAPSHDPVVWHGSAGRGGAQAECEIPSQD